MNEHFSHETSCLLALAPAPAPADRTIMTSLLDPRIILTFTNQTTNTSYRGIAFDSLRGRLLVTDVLNHRVLVLSIDDGSLVSSFGDYGHSTCQLSSPVDVAIDHENGTYVLVADSDNHRVMVLSADEHSFVCQLGRYGQRPLELRYPAGVAIDHHLDYVLVSDTVNHRVQVLRMSQARELSFLFALGSEGHELGQLSAPGGLAVDSRRGRIVVMDSLNHRVQVFSAIDGSFLFAFGSQGDQPGQFYRPRRLCIDSQGRIIVADTGNCRLQSFTPEGHHISSLDCRASTTGVAFDEHRGLIAFSTDDRVHVIGANQWLADTFTWRPDRHRYAPRWMKQAISTMTMIRSLVDDSESASMSMIPNEILFEIFSFL